MKKIKVMIVDDEPLAREAIGLRLSAFSDFIVIAEADNGYDALVLAKSLKPDLIFIDIEMPEMNGLAVVKRILEWQACQIVFITAYHHFAVEAFRVNAVDYLLKPINDLYFAETVSRLRQLCSEKVENHSIIQICNSLGISEILNDQQPSYLTRLAVDDCKEKRMISVSKIESITSARNYLSILVGEKLYLMRATLTATEAMLDPSMFIKVNRSVLVNKKMICQFQTDESGTYVVTEQQNRYIVSRRCMATVKQMFKSF